MVSQLKQQGILIYTVEVHQAAFSEACLLASHMDLYIALKLVSLKKNHHCT